MAPRKDLETEWAYHHKVGYKTHFKLRDFSFRPPFVEKLRTKSAKNAIGL